jgi:uncharacterized repeat protein (TIGR01451 family)
MSLHKILVASVLLAGLSLPAAALAQPEITLEITVQKEVVVVENGVETITLEPTDVTVPGDTLEYTLTYRNVGDEKATNVVLNNPIPGGCTYVPGSATKEKAELDFSIDGQAYKKPALLTYEVTLPNGTRETRVASPEEYTHIRWRVSEVLPNEVSSVSFKVKIK